MYGKHIALITPGFPANETDTTCITALQLLVRSLKETGCELTVFALHYPFTYDTYRWHGIRVVPLNGRNHPIRRKLLLRKMLQRAFEQVHREHPFDLVHTFWLNEATLWGVELARVFGIPCVATAMGQDVLPENTFLRSLYKRPPDMVITLSGFQQAELRRTNGMRSEVIPHGIDPGLCTPCEKTISIIGVGNLIPLKNYDYFIRVCAELRKERPDIVVYLVGTGTERKQLERLIRIHGLEEVVTLAGQLPYEETLQLLARSKVLLHPSWFEGFGMVFTEALHVRTHILASPVGFAADHELISRLTIHLQHDVAHLIGLLESGLPEQRTHSVTDSATAYLGIYDRLLNKIQ